MIRIPNKVRKGDAIRAQDFNDLLDVVASLGIVPGTGYKVARTAAGQLLTIKPGKSGGGGVVAADCPFGRITTVGADTVILGGLLVCGDQNFAVPNQVIDLETDGAWLVEISLTGVTPATDDDEEIFLSGVTTATGTPAWANTAYTGTEDYTDTTNPAAPGSTGTAIIPIGILTISSGSASLTPTGCGTITIGQCAGIISHSRG